MGTVLAPDFRHRVAVDALGQVMATVEQAPALESPPAADQSAPVPPSAGRRAWPARAAVIAAIVAAAALVRFAPWSNHQPDTTIVASGRIEAREVTVAPKDIQARVAELFVDESDHVTRGQLLAVLTADQLDARSRTLTANVHALEAQIAQAEFDVTHTEREVDATIAAATAAVAAATANVQKAHAVRDNANASYERSRTLLDERVLSQAEFDGITMSYRTADADVNAAAKALEQAEANLAVAKSARDTIVLKQRQVEALQANRRAVLAQIAELDATQAERRVVAPASGTVVARAVEVGDVVNPGSPLFTLVDMDRLYVKVYIPEPDIPKLKLGAPADVTVDAFPGRTFAGRVTKIFDQAEFTPKNVETADERVKLVFGVEVSVANAERLLKPGMPADCRIAWTPAAEPGRHDQ